MFLPMRGLFAVRSNQGIFMFYVCPMVISIARFLSTFFSGLKVSRADQKVKYKVLSHDVEECYVDEASSHGVFSFSGLKDLVLGHLYHPVFLQVVYLILQ